jgi:hypothetical protein
MMYIQDVRVHIKENRADLIDDYLPNPDTPMPSAVLKQFVNSRYKLLFQVFCVWCFVYGFLFVKIL